MNPVFELAHEKFSTRESVENGDKRLSVSVHETTGASGSDARCPSEFIASGRSRNLTINMAIPAKMPETPAEITNYWLLQIDELRKRVSRREIVEGDYHELHSLLTSLQTAIGKEFYARETRSR